MKKFLAILSLSFLTVGTALLSSCSGGGKICIYFGDKNATDVTTIKFTKLEEMVNSKENFMIAVQYSDGCACWSSDAHPVLQKYVQDNQVNIYHIKYDELRAHENTFGIKIITGNVSFAIFEEGQCKVNLNTRENPPLKDYELFTSFMKDTINLPKFYYVTLDDVKNMYKSSEKSVIYFSRNSCGDCSYINEHFLKDWNKSHPNYSKKMYVLDCDQKGIRFDDQGEYNEKQWYKFKDDYGLSTANNTVYGYGEADGGGYVPSFYLIQGSQSKTTFLSGAVAFNDKLAKDGDNYKVVNSYYTEERLSSLQYIDDSVRNKVLVGLSVNASDVTLYGQYISWNHDAAEKYHNPLLEKFFDYVEKQ